MGDSHGGRCHGPLAESVREIPCGCSRGDEVLRAVEGRRAMLRSSGLLPPLLAGDIEETVSSCEGM